MKRTLCGAVAVLASCTWAACGGTVAVHQGSGEAGGTTTTTSSTSPVTAILCQQVPCVPPDGGGCDGCMMSCGLFPSTCAGDPTCACVMANAKAFCPFNTQALTCTDTGGEVSVTCGPCV